MNDFWDNINAQLDRIEAEKPDTFAGVRDILMDPQYSAVVDDVNLNGSRTFTERHAFFAGSGGDRSLYEALYRAGWHMVWAEASYYYVVRHNASHAFLTYIEGDVYEGDAR